MNFSQPFYAALILLSFKVIAQPDAASKQLVNDIVIYQDYEDKHHFYYVPYGLKLISDTEGKPDFKFLQMRYTGTLAYGDQGTNRFRSLLNFGVSQHMPNKIERNQIIASLKRRGFIVRSLQPIPLSGISATLVHAADETVPDSLKHSISGGFFESNNTSFQNGNWRTRDFSLRFNKHDAQLFWESFQGNQPTLSVNYSYIAKLVTFKSEEFVTQGSDSIMSSIKDIAVKSDSVLELKEMVIKSDALPIRIDLKKWPNLIKQIDINEQIPSDYAALDVYCYDFYNELRQNLFAKKIEIKAIGVGGAEVSCKETFTTQYPDEYAKNIHFVYAVKLSEPYQYRVIEVYDDGTFYRTDWKTVGSWHQILDITSKIIHE